jgi:CDP-diacylglycerol--serine O-phosphatidyltransferase
MERIKIILNAGAISAFFFWLVFIIVKYRADGLRKYILSPKGKWLHPNLICLWRTLLAFLSDFLYFGTSYHNAAIYLFTFSATLDGVDGYIARKCNLITEAGKELDPLCDKLTYLPPIIGFAWRHYMNFYLVLLFTGFEVIGQLSRRLLSGYGYQSAATIVGKIKAWPCFMAVIYFAVFENGEIGTKFYGNEIIVICTIMSFLSIVSKINLKNGN